MGQIPVVPLYTKILKPGFNTVVKPIFCLVRIVSPSSAHSANNGVRLEEVAIDPTPAPYGDPLYAIPQPTHPFHHDDMGDRQWRGGQRQWGMPDV
jgi:hypothetical protein